MLQQADLFETASEYPAGFRYAAEFISRAEERRLIDHLQRLEFKPFDFHGFVGKRRVVSFGWRYDFNGGGLTKTDDMPDFLLPVRERAAISAGLRPTDLQQVLLTEYQPGAPIGWHKDRSVFGDVMGISLLSACTFRFRRKAGARWERSSLVLAPRSAYLLHGPARTEWEHSIPAVTELRYSITFRNFRDGARGNAE
ncbi:MAG: alpha-ketoglutarate-dependent dioxygenase AlkB [Hyphomicrobiales bacterium]|nr:alpha-ketoglutarate-dependent dioxygenase AlkB [Hyphomicrobiales bacterium]MBV8823866.1 alpha-ketoglutarate-dependent dioxygenase AlkB [Hyphomicrobiales bacterium]